MKLERCWPYGTIDFPWMWKKFEACELKGEHAIGGPTIYTEYQRIFHAFERELIAKSKLINFTKIMCPSGFSEFSNEHGK